jgi:hypothetical protein
MATNAEDIDGSTVDGAVERLRQTRPEAPAQEAAEAEDSEVLEEEVIHEDAPLEAQEEDLDTETEEVLEEEDELQEDYAPTLEPPSSWSGDAKEKWSQLPDDVKEVIIQRDKDRDRGIHQRLNELAEQEKTAKAAREEAEKLAADARQRLERLTASDELKPPPTSMLDVNSDDYDPDAYHLQRARYEERKEAMTEQQRELRRQREEEMQKAQEARLAQVEASKNKLLQRFPSWAKDPEKGVKAIGELRDYMTQTGVPRELAERVYDADMLTYVWKARQYDKLRQSKKAETRPKVSRPAPKKAPPRESDVRKAEKTFQENGTVENAARLLAMQRKA